MPGANAAPVIRGRVQAIHDLGLAEPGQLGAAAGRRAFRPVPGAGQPALRRAILVSLPVIVLSFVFQRQFVRGMLSGSVKG